MCKIIFAIFWFLMSFDVYALGSSNVILDCNNEIDNLENIVVHVEVDSKEVLGISANLIYDKSKLTLISYSGNNDFEVTLGNSIIFDTYERSNSKEKMGTLIFKVTSNFKNGETTTIKLVDIVATDGKREVFLNSSETTLKIKDDVKEGLLTGIYIDNEKVVNFDSRIKEYFVTILDKDNIDLSVTTINKNINVKNIGKIDISEKNKAVIVATDENDYVEEYTIYFNKRNANLEEENLDESTIFKGLKSISIKGYDIDFSFNKYEYFLNVSEEVEEIDIIAVPINDNSLAKIHNKKLVGGDNQILIEVLEYNGETTNYYINVYKEANNNSFLYIIIVIIVLIIIIVLGIIIFFISRKKKSKKNIEPVNMSFPNI